MTEWYLAQGIQYNNTRILTRAATSINFREHNQGLYIFSLTPVSVSTDFAQ